MRIERVASVLFVFAAFKIISVFVCLVFLIKLFFENLKISKNPKFVLVMAYQLRRTPAYFGPRHRYGDSNAVESTSVG